MNSYERILEIKNIGHLRGDSLAGSPTKVTAGNEGDMFNIATEDINADLERSIVIEEKRYP